MLDTFTAYTACDMITHTKKNAETGTDKQTIRRVSHSSYTSTYVYLIYLLLITVVDHDDDTQTQIT